ncbi:TetR family transcriptional regulator [Streptomyces triticagri]|uniref:TetR family transcriptional regulator n=1 Tax=Streptomyces triticagri TaxID=2293568 RepID=A0A372M1A3_9ACTN|nr:helix-turn-helix domain-containing protein [Streptomyces triticagri]RFU84716.1 TetR family transcriptional regulator [Streptomyces triticagri]
MVAIRTSRERILRAAVYELAERGYPGCSLRSVARRAGVDSRLLAHYFGDKDSLCAEALQQRCEPLPAPLHDRASGAGRPVAAALLHEWRGEPPLRRALFASALTEERYGVTMRSLLTGVLGGVGGSESRAGRRRTALAVSVVLGLGLLAQAGTADTEARAPRLAADLGAYLDLLLADPPPLGDPPQ